MLVGGGAVGDVVGDGETPGCVWAGGAAGASTTGGACSEG